jgi:hypothetical protein
LIPFCPNPYVLAVGVGSEHEETIAEVRGTDGCRWNAVPLRSPPARGQVAEDAIEGALRAEEARNILQEHVARSNLADHAPDVIPYPPRVHRSGSLPGDADRLTREAGSDEIHSVAPRATIEGCELVPDSSLIQPRLSHPGHEDGRREGLPFDNAHKAKVRACERNAPLEAANSSAERDGCARSFNVGT